MYEKIITFGESSNGIKDAPSDYFTCKSLYESSRVNFAFFGRCIVNIYGLSNEKEIIDIYYLIVLLVINSKISLNIHFLHYHIGYI